MKPTKTKAQIRSELEKEIENFLSVGGTVNEIDRGISGREDPSKSLAAHSSFEPKKSRTPVNDVVQTLEERKKVKNSKLAPKRQPRKKLITDDFGEPIRW